MDNTTGRPIACNDTSYIWIEGLTYNTTGWERYTSDSELMIDYFYQGMTDYEKVNEMWDQTPKKWIAPMNMANWPDQRLFSDDFPSHSTYNGESTLRQYTVMVYYSILAIGQNDYMPKNEEEYGFCMLVLLFSAILNTIIFGNIASLASSVAHKSL